MSSDQEKILLLQNEFHLSQLALKECGLELQKIKARLLQDLLDLEIHHHVNEKKAYDVEMAQLKRNCPGMLAVREMKVQSEAIQRKLYQFDAVRSEMEQIKLAQAVPLKATVARTDTVSSRDILSISASDTMPTEPVAMEQEEAPVVINDTSSSSHQGQTAVSLSVSILSDEERMIHDCQSDACNTEQTTDNQRWNNNEPVSDVSQNVAELKKAKVDKVGKGKNKKRNKNEIAMEVTNERVDRTSPFVTECHSKEDGHTDVLNSLTNAELVDKATKHSALNDLQQLHEDPVNGISLMEAEKQYDESIPLPTSHSTTSNATICNGSAEGHDNIALVHLSSDDTVMDSTVPVENNVSDETGTGKQQACEESVMVCKDSVPAEMHYQTANCNDTPQLPHLHRESPSSSSQGLALVTESLDVQDFDNEAETRRQMDMQGMDSDVAVMKLEEQKKQKSTRNKKGVSKKKRGRGRPRKKTRMVDKVTTVPDSTGIQNDYGIQNVCPNSKSSPVPVGNTISNDETQSSPEPSISSTSNGPGDFRMESSSNYREATIHVDQEFVTAKKLKLENNLIITAPSNLVTSTSSDNVESARCDVNACTGNNDNNMSRPSEPDAVASLMDGGNLLTSDVVASEKVTSRPQGINRRKPQRPKKRKNVTVTTTTVKTEVHNDRVVGTDNHINHAMTNISPSVGPTNTIDKTVQNKSILQSHGQQQSVGENNDVIEREQPFQFSMIPGSIKSEPEAFTITAAVPVTKNSMESVGEKAHGQKLNDNRQRKLLSLKSLNRRLMPDISFTGTTGSSVIFNLHNMTAPKLKVSVKPTLK